jgi:hypothetical protein
MEKVRLVVYDDSIQPVIDILHKYYTPDFTKYFGKDFIFIAERYNLLVGFRVSLTVIIERTENALVIEMIGTGGQTSFYGLGSGRVYTTIKALADAIVTYCNDNNIKGKQVKGESTF